MKLLTETQTDRRMLVWLHYLLVEVKMVRCCAQRCIKYSGLKYKYKYLSLKYEYKYKYSGLKYKYEYSGLKYKYEYKYLSFKYKYKYKYLVCTASTH